MLSPHAVGREHYDIALAVRRTLAEYEELKDIIAILGLEELARSDRATVARARRLERFLTQPFFSTEAFTGQSGRFVSRDETLECCARILDDELAQVPEKALYMIGGVDDLERALEEQAP